MNIEVSGLVHRELVASTFGLKRHQPATDPKASPLHSIAAWKKNHWYPGYPQGGGWGEGEWVLDQYLGIGELPKVWKPDPE